MKEIPLTKGYFAIVDDDMFPILMQYNWHVTFKKDKPYASRNNNSSSRKKDYMHW